MNKNVLIGAAAGILAFLLSWSRNSTPHLISVFPDVLTLVLFVLLLSWVIHFAVGRLKVPAKSSVIRTGSAVTVATGGVFGFGLVLLSVFRLSTQSLPVAAFGFGVALGSAMVVGTIATLVETRRITGEASDQTK